MRITGRTDLAVATTMAVATAAITVGIGPLLERANGQAQATTTKAKDARLRFEINATDGDGGVHVLFDADDWQRLSIFDPTGTRILTTTTEGRMGRQGSTELFVESAEPPFSKLPLSRLLTRWPEGLYRFAAKTVAGTAIVGSARLTHDLPDGPKLVSPSPSDGPQNPARTVVRWRFVAPANGSPIIGYQVLVVQPSTGLRALPKVVLDVMMPSTATSLAIPPGFLQPGLEYEWEVLAIERGGNQTLSSSAFTTAK